MEVLEHLPRPLLEVRRRDDRPVLLGREAFLDRLAVRGLRHEREQPVALVADHAREDDLELPADPVLRDHAPDGLLAALVAAGRLEDLRDVLHLGLHAERVRDLAADVERLGIGVGLGHQQRQRPLRSEGARAKTDRDRAVDSAGDSDDASAPVQVARDDRAQRLLDFLRDALRVDREGVRRDLVHRQAAWPDWRFLSTNPTMFSIESRFSGNSSSFVIRTPNCSSR